MADISLVGMGAQVTGAGPLTPTYPGGYTAVAGDWAEIWVTGLASANTPPATMSGYTALGGTWLTGELNIIYVFAKILGASEAQPSIALPTNWSVFAVQVGIRRNTGVPTSLDSALVGSTAATATTWAQANQTTANPKACLVSGVNTNFDNAVNLLAGSEQGFTQRAGGASYDVAGSFSFALGDRNVAVAGSTTMPTWNQTVNASNAWAGLKFSIKAAVTAPAAPTIYSVGGGHERAGVEWTAGDDGNSAVTDWDIDHATAAAPTTWLGPTATGSTAASGAVTGLTNSTAYVFRVRAVNAVGDGAWSATSSSATPTDVRGFFDLESGDELLLEDGTSFQLLEAGAAAGGGVSLVVADALHDHTVDNVALTQHNVLAVQDAVHAHTVDNAALTQHNVLVAADATQGHTADAVALTQHNALAVADALHGHSVDAVVVEAHDPGAVTLVVQAADHTHSVDNVALTQHNVLVVADALHGHSVDAAVLTQHNVLAVAGADQGHTADNVTLGIGDETLIVADATHAHTADSVALVQHNILELADTVHAHTVDNVTLTQHHLLIVDDTLHNHLVGVVLFTIPDVGGTGSGSVAWRDGGSGAVTGRDVVSAGVVHRDAATSTVTHRDSELAQVGAAQTGSGEVRQP